MGDRPTYQSKVGRKVGSAVSLSVGALGPHLTQLVGYDLKAETQEVEQKVLAA